MTKPTTSLTREKLLDEIEYTVTMEYKAPNGEPAASRINRLMQLIDTYTQAKEREALKSDEHHLHRYFHYYLDTMYKKHGLDDIRYMFMDGFEEPLEPDYLCDAIYELAERLGYKLENNMWIETPKLKNEKENL